MTKKDALNNLTIHALRNVNNKNNIPSAFCLSFLRN